MPQMLIATIILCLNQKEKYGFCYHPSAVLSLGTMRDKSVFLVICETIEKKPDLIRQGTS